jgi:hypothetical protein
MINIAYPILKEPIASGRPSEPLNKLKVEIDYSKQGWSCLCGEPYKGGIYIYLTPCRHENGVTGTFWNGDIHTMGYKILLKEMGRKSQKQIDLAASIIMPKAQEIADLYSTGNHREVYNLIKEISK